MLDDRLVRCGQFFQCRQQAAAGFRLLVPLSPPDHLGKGISGPQPGVLKTLIRNEVDGNGLRSHAQNIHRSPPGSIPNHPAVARLRLPHPFQNQQSPIPHTSALQQAVSAKAAAGCTHSVLRKISQNLSGFPRNPEHLPKRTVAWPISCLECVPLLKTPTKHKPHQKP